MPDPAKEPPLHEHMEATYFNLRYGMMLVAVALLLVPVFAKISRNVPLQGSLSAYYHADNGEWRDFFVGALVALGALLYLYKGFGRKENYALNLAGACAVGVAMIPMEWKCGTSCARYSMHALSAVMFFACIAYVCWFRASDTLELLADRNTIRKYKRTYKTLGILMIAAPLATIGINTWLQRPGEESRLVLLVEVVAVLVFAAYWLTKTAEMRKTHAERLALKGAAERATITNSEGEVTQAVIATQGSVEWPRKS